MDLSYLEPYLHEVSERITKTRHDKEYDTQRYTINLPNVATICLQHEVYVQMSASVFVTSDGRRIVNRLKVPTKGTDCRGSPLIRSP